MKLMSFLLAGMLTASSASAQSLGLFEGNSDVGAVAISGGVDYDPETQEFVVRGSGATAGFESDAFHVVWRRLSGDFILRADAKFAGEGEDAEGEDRRRKMGWIVRTGLDSSAAYVSAAVHGNGLTALEYRSEAGATTEEVPASIPAPDVIQLERQGDRFVLSAARHGDVFGAPVSREVALGEDVYVGLFVSVHGDERIEEARFRNVRMVVPPGEEHEAYQDYLGSNLEIMNVDTGLRKILYRSDQSLQAPNWTPDGRALIYNSNGLLYRFDLETGEPEVIDTDFATDNNNDHVISFDGTQLAISHHADEHDGQSIIYTVPIAGGTPEKVTQKGPSYLHGWSPDGEFLTYTGLRDGEYDIYVIPAEGGEEIRLTDAEGLDDGSEYSPDGEYIYFNSVRTGSMEIWRMRPDGSDQEQLTADSLNNWFPHVSPDGSRIVFLTYGTDVAPDDHPFYKQVYLRMMPVDGGEPEVIAYLYGGQGTINVPSWAPDGRRIAFVSNTDLEIRGAK